MYVQRITSHLAASLRVMFTGSGEEVEYDLTDLAGMKLHDLASRLPKGARAPAALAPRADGVQLDSDWLRPPFARAVMPAKGGSHGFLRAMPAGRVV